VLASFHKDIMQWILDIVKNTPTDNPCKEVKERLL
jgi:hypothetical protein